MADAFADCLSLSLLVSVQLVKTKQEEGFSPDMQKVINHPVCAS